MLAIIVVTYNPSLPHLRDLMARTRSSAAFFIVVDNASAMQPAVADIAAEFGAVEVLNQSNIGLASAHNRGIELARRLGAQSILLLDQDSSLSAEHIAGLRSALRDLLAAGESVAAVGPAYTEANTDRLMRLPRAGKWSIDWGAVAPVAASDTTLPHRHRGDFVISSGALMPIAAIEAVGPMEERLFIDLIDVEWGLRAARLGYHCFVDPAIAVPHTIGHGRLSVLGRTAVVHSPMRNYYWVRNAIALSKRASIPLPWRLFFVRKAMIHAVAYPLFADQKRSRLRHAAKGAWHGLIGSWAGPRPADKRQTA